MYGIQTFQPPDSSSRDNCPEWGRRTWDIWGGGKLRGSLQKMLRNTVQELGELSFSALSRSEFSPIRAILNDSDNIFCLSKEKKCSNREISINCAWFCKKSYTFYPNCNGNPARIRVLEKSRGGGGRLRPPASYANVCTGKFWEGQEQQ